MTLKQRLDLIVKELGLSGRAFEKQCELTNGSYSSIGNGVGADKLNKILAKFPQINAEWLISGRGEMFKSEPRLAFRPESRLATRPEPKPTTRPVGRPAAASVTKQVAAPVSKSADARLENVGVDEKPNPLVYLTGIMANHQQQVSQLIAELERIGQRFDHVLNLIESENGGANGSRNRAGSKNVATQPERSRVRLHIQ